MTSRTTQGPSPERDARGSAAAVEGGPADHGEAPKPTLLYAVKQVELAARAHLDDLLKPGNLTALQYTALTVLARREHLTAAELARHSFVTPQSMGDLVSALLQRGLIERDRDPDNRRRLVISLTSSGHEVLRRFADEVEALEERMVAGLTARQREDLATYLDRCRSALADGPER